ncbi:MAG: hypothetical protein J6J60_06880 [Clostridia bacterium]|nr:hypothetical protein [Clostridia bacterium]
MNKIFIPSVEYERKTKALTKYTIVFALLIFLIIMIILELGNIPKIIYKKYNIQNSFFLENSLQFTLAFVLIIFALTFLIKRYLNTLKTSYIIEDDKIIKGVLKLSRKNIRDFFNELGDNFELRNMFMSYYDIHYGNSIAKSIIINFQRAKFNLDNNFVTKFFNTSLYKKKIYENPELIKIKKHSLIYMYSNNKKIIIPRIYEGIIEKEVHKTSSFFALRVIKALIILFIISIILVFVDMQHPLPTEFERKYGIEYVTKNLNNYGYNLEKQDDNYYLYTKNVGTNISKIEYNSETTKFKIELYYFRNQDRKERDKELSYIIPLLFQNVQSEDIHEFLDYLDRKAKGNGITGSTNIGSGNWHTLYVSISNSKYVRITR